MPNDQSPHTGGYAYMKQPLQSIKESDGIAVGMPVTFQQSSEPQPVRASASN
jgi:hypothetical protein